MSRLSKEEIATRRQKMREEALRSIAKTEQLNIRVDQESITRLYSLAGKLGKPVGTMVREWILDRLHLEEEPIRNESVEKLIDLITSLHVKIDRLNGYSVEKVGRKHRKVS